MALKSFLKISIAIRNIVLEMTCDTARSFKIRN